MGSTETDKPAKETNDPAKETPTSQSSGNAMGAVPPDWTGFQAYSSMPPHGYLAASPQPHPYMWGVQHLMPPYGTAPHPYVAMYPHGGLYPHPSLPPGSYPYSPYAMPSPNGVPEASGNTPASMEVNGKSPEGKEKLPIKRSKGSLGSLNMTTGKNNEPKNVGASANGSYPKSAESGSEGSSEGSDANSDNNSQMISGSRQDSIEGEALQNGNDVHGSQNGLFNQSMTIVPVAAAGPTTNLNMGMEYWSGPSSSNIHATHGNITSISVAGGMVTVGSRESMQPQLWLQDERELKRQRRKQSNRESARRSRLRKQAECDELAQRAEALNEENASLRAEVSRIRNDYEQLLAENASLKERLGEIPGQEEARNEQNMINQDGQSEPVQSG
uniref:bZIP transcription factor 16-like isoform X2 n=1 Tax=Erigeron canadensis TaxID=72917 RepID=UPI001CB8A387|nr:bZIP transcription factor 16-like isoform X2 [Erigeron canadensis]